MATLTQAEAQALLNQMSTVGVPTRTVNRYGGLQAIQDIAGGPAYVEQRLAEEAANNALRDAYNSGAISAAQIEAMSRQIDAGQDTTTAINRTLAQAAAPGTYSDVEQPAASAYDYIDQYLYQPFLGRPGEAAGREFYGQEFGPYVDAAEAARFIQGAVDSGEITPERGNELLNQVSGYSYIEPLYQEYLGRPGDIGGLTSYAQSFGPEIDLAERQAFIEGAVGAGELSRARADELLAGLTAGTTTDVVTDTGGTTTGGTTTGGSLTSGNLSFNLGKGETPDYRSQIIDLYETQLGRTPSETEVQGWLSQIGKTLDKEGTKYTFDDLTRDFGIGAQRELGYRQRQEFVRNIPQFQQTVVPEIEFPTAPRPAPVLGLTGLPTTPQNIQALYQSRLGRPAGLQEIARQQELMGPIISPQKASDFAASTAQELAGAGNAYRPFTGVGYAQPIPTEAVEARAGGVINYAEGGEAALAEPTSPRLTAQDLGSRFDVESYKDEQGRLVGGYSRPILDEYGVIIGYEDRPYERDVVFGERLRERQAAAPLDTEQAMLDMLARQGRTGVNPMTGGLAGIQVGGPMMRSQPQYYSTIEAGRRYRGFAKGGLADVAQDLASKGRFGDTMVAHISPQEAGLLKAMGGSGTINPKTGLPEFFSLFPKKGIKLNLGPLGNIKVGAKSSNIIQAAAALAAGDVMGLTAGQAALAYGGVRAAATGNLMEGIQAGLTAYGMGNMYEGLSGTTIGTPSGTAPIDTVQVGAGAGGGAAESAMVSSQNVPIQGTEAEFLAARPEFGQATSEALSGMATELPETTLGVGVGDPSTMSALERADIMTPPGKTAWTPPASVETGSVDFGQGFLRETLPASVQKYTPDFLLDASGKTLLMGAGLTTAAAGMQADKARAAQLRALAAAQEEERRKRFAPQIASLPPLYSSGMRAREGGLMKLAGGGMTYMEAGGTTGATGEPRDVTGTGDGMSDSVPASIEGVQEARLADGEFVIPADVVADIGNGSSDAGSKKLYDMMDRIRMARHGTKEQPPEIKAERLMPA